MYALHTYIDPPVVKITAATGGCGYVYVSWNVTNNIELCQIVQYNVTLSSSTVNIIISSSEMNSHNFTELSGDTLFNVTVTGINAMGFASNPDSTSIRTMICISTYICTYMCSDIVHIVCFMY